MSIRHNSEWWNKRRVLAALGEFYGEFKKLPSSFEEYAEIQQAANFDYAGKISTRGQDNLYPSVASIGKFFKSINDAWREVGFDVTDAFAEWTIEEDLFIYESIGLLTREEIAECLPGKRSATSVKARVNYLQLDIFTRWGITAARAANYLEISSSVLEKYIESGEIPFIQGSAYLYIDPADLLLVREIDWSKPVHSELTEMIKDSLIERMLRIIAGKPLRKYPYKFGRRSKPRKYLKTETSLSAWNNLPPKPNELKAGDWVTINFPASGVDITRSGIIKSLNYSPQSQTRHDGTKRCCWVGIVEFPRYSRGAADTNPPRVRLSLPLDCLLPAKAVEKPKREIKSPETIRKRKYLPVRRKKAQKRRARLLEIGQTG